MWEEGGGGVGVDDCFIHGCVFCYWMCQSFLSECVFFFQSWFLVLSLWIFYLSLPTGFSGQMISGVVSCLLDLNRIFK